MGSCSLAIGFVLCSLHHARLERAFEVNHCSRNLLRCHKAFLEIDGEQPAALPSVTSRTVHHFLDLRELAPLLAILPSCHRSPRSRLPCCRCPTNTASPCPTRD